MAGKLIRSSSEDFGPEQNQPLDADAVKAAFAELAKEMAANRQRRSPTASSRCVETWDAIKKISSSAAMT